MTARLFAALVHKAYVSFKGRPWQVPAPSAASASPSGVCYRWQYRVFFAAHHVATIDLTQHQSVGDVSEQVSVMSPG